jgi:hypothetical protein
MLQLCHKTDFGQMNFFNTLPGRDSFADDFLARAVG